MEAIYQKIEKSVKERILRARSVAEKLMPILWNYNVWQGKYARINVWFRINCENISNHAFCSMKLNWLKEEHYFNKIASKDTKKRIEVIFWSHESFVSLCFLDLENETFLNITSIINPAQLSILSTFSKILKTARVVYQQYSPFGAKIYSVICRRTLSVPIGEQFSESESRGKLWATRDR